MLTLIELRPEAPDANGSRVTAVYVDEETGRRSQELITDPDRIKALYEEARKR